MQQSDEHIANSESSSGAPEQIASEPEVLEILSKYWAAEKDGPTFWSTCQDKEREFFDAYARRGFFNITRLSFSMYFGTTNNQGTGGQWQTQSLSYGGSNQELLEFSVNEYRSFCDQIFNMACKNRPAFEAQAVNTDYKSLAQIEAADSLVTYFYEEVYGERQEREVVKIEGLYGKAFTHIEWDPDDGEIIAVPQKIPSPLGPVTTKPQMQRAGKLRIGRKFPWDVICEPYRSEHDEHLWRMVIEPKRAKVEMQARWPAFAKQIEDSTLCPSLYEYSIPGADPLAQEAEGLCAIRIFYHKRTMAMPTGRKVIFVNDVMVSDEDLPVDDIPVVPFFSCELHGTSFCVSDLWNLIPLDQMQNQVLSDMATNLESFGRPSLALVEGSDIDIDSLANGQKLVFVPPGKDFMPQPIKFPEFPSFSPKMLEILKQTRQSLSGLNAIARGDTSTNVTSGAHAALYSQIAVEAQSDRQLALDLHRERVGNLIVKFLKAFAKHPQMVAIAGIDQRSYLQYFTEKDWQGVQRVRIKTVNPIMKTQAGRIQLVELLKNFPGIPLKDPQQIVELITSGQFKPMISTTRTSELRIRYENEKLLEGPEVQQVPDPVTGMVKTTVPSVPVLATDNATSHLFGHLECLNSPAAMNDPKLSGAILAHIMEHVELARNGDSYLAQLLGNPMPMQPAAPGGPAADPHVTGQGPTQSEEHAVQQSSTPPSLDTTDDSNSKLPTPATPPPGAAVA